MLYNIIPYTVRRILRVPLLSVTYKYNFPQNSGKPVNNYTRNVRSRFRI